MTTKEFSKIFNHLTAIIKDPRLRRKKLYTLQEVLLVVLLGELCGCSGWKEFEDFAKCRMGLFRKFYPYVHGIPSDDTMRRLFRRLGFLSFQKIFKTWIKSLSLPQDLSIAIDGKVSKGTLDANGSQLHTVSAYATEKHLVLGQEKTNEKSNEITAIPKLIKSLDLEKGTTITIDAMGCQRDICKLIIESNADYCIAIKENQPTLFQAVQEAFASKDYKTSINTTFDEAHGRTEERVTRVMKVPEELQNTHSWPGLTSIVEISSTRTINGETTKCKRYYLSSLKPNAKKQAKIIRSHWSIENNLHWIMDTAFKDDRSRICQGNAPENLSVIKHFCFNLLKMAQPKYVSINRLRKMAGYNEEKMLDILSNIQYF